MGCVIDPNRKPSWTWRGAVFFWVIVVVVASLYYWGFFYWGM